MIHKITKKQVMIADPGVGMVKLKPEEFFGEVHEEGNYSRGKNQRRYRFG